MMILAKKVRLKPTEEQERQLWKSVGTARWAYNWALNKQIENYKNGGKFISDGELRKELTQLKKTEEYAWLKEVSNNVTKQAIKDLCKAYKNFFNGKAKHPKFKSKKKSRPSFYNDNMKLKVKDHLVLVLLEKIGWVKTSEQIPMGVKYKNPRVSYDGKYWYLSVGIEFEPIHTDLTDNVIGIDVGIKHLAVCSDGRVFSNVNKTSSVKRLEKRLHRLQRQVSRKYEMNKKGNRFVKTCNIIKLEKKIRLIQRKLTNIRKNHIFQSVNAIVKTKPSVIAMEDLNITGMMKNKHLAKAVQDQKLYEFKRVIRYKCEWLGIKFVEVDRWFPSSKLCCNCGQIKKDLKLSDRTYTCDCGNKIDRDLNASINLAKYAIHM